VGPTAVGKTSLSILFAKHFSTEIISADSRQCYKELCIGVARPSLEELAEVTHHFIASHSIHNEVNAAQFEQYALQKIDEIFQKNDVAIMVGGTGLYIKAFCEGMDEIPATDPNIRKDVVSQYLQKGLSWLQEEVKIKDPFFYKIGEILNPQRLMRALEVKLSTGNSIVEYRTLLKKQRDFNIIKIGLQMPREKLYKRINSRVDNMIQSGLIDEVRTVLPYRKLNALQTVGYRELFEYFDGKISLNEAVEAIKQNTRHYAKRQMTWFKKDLEIIWCTPDFNEVMEHLKILF
jgi:tRNA dimethylallyltransferase